jgi:hypothetical protein
MLLSRLLRIALAELWVILMDFCKMSNDKSENLKIGKSEKSGNRVRGMCGFAVSRFHGKIVKIGNSGQKSENRVHGFCGFTVSRLRGKIRNS